MAAPLGGAEFGGQRVPRPGERRGLFARVLQRDRCRSNSSARMISGIVRAASPAPRGRRDPPAGLPRPPFSSDIGPPWLLAAVGCFRPRGAQRSKGASGTLGFMGITRSVTVAKRERSRDCSAEMFSGNRTCRDRGSTRTGLGRAAMSEEEARLAGHGRRESDSRARVSRAGPTRPARPGNAPMRRHASGLGHLGANRDAGRFRGGMSAPCRELLAAAPLLLRERQPLRRPAPSGPGLARFGVPVFHRRGLRRRTFSGRAARL